VKTAVLARQAGMIVLVRRAHAPFAGHWGLPAGWVEGIEDPAAVAVRECHAQTGLDIELDRLFQIYFFDDEPRGNGILIVYLATVVGGELTGSAEGEVGFFAPHALPEPILGGGHERALRDWVQATHESAASRPARYCPKCAHQLVERHIFGRERQMCDVCGFILFRDPKIAAGALVEHNGRVLLALRSISPEKGKWYVPGGFVEFDESIEGAAIREVHEETGLEIALDGLLRVYSFGNRRRGFGHLILYRAHPVGGILQAGEEVDAVAFFGPDELPPNIAFTTSQDALNMWIAEQKAKQNAQRDG